MKKILKSIELYPYQMIGFVTVFVIVSIFIFGTLPQTQEVAADTPHPPCYTVDACGSNVQCEFAITDPNLCGLGGVGM